MRSEEEKKSIIKSIKLSPTQLRQIEEKAAEKNMSFGGYMVDCATHENSAVTPLMAVKFQELVNMVYDIADNLDGQDYMRKEELRQKADNLGELFNFVTPKEKYENLERKMELFVEGGLGVWEYLKS